MIAATTKTVKIQKRKRNVKCAGYSLISGGEKVKMHRVPIQGLEPRVEFESLLVRVPVSENVRL